MSHPADQFITPVIFGLRNTAVYHMNSILDGGDVFAASEKTRAAVAKLTQEDRDALRADLTKSVDASVHQFLYTLDDAANTKGGLAVTYSGKPITNGDYAFTDRLSKWVTDHAHHDATGKPNEKAYTGPSTQPKTTPDSAV